MRRRPWRGRRPEGGRDGQRSILLRAAHPERRVRRQGVVVVEPATELREYRLRVAQLGVSEIVAFERPHKGFGQAVALGTVRRRRDGDQAELVRIEYRGCRGVLRAVVAEPLNRVRRLEGGLPEA